MGRALLLASAIASALLLLSCQKSQTPQMPAAAVADSKSGFCLVPDVSLWEISGTSLTRKGSVQIGEKLVLLGQARHVALNGKDRDLLKVRQDTGTEGWVRADYVVSNAILAVTTSDAVIYSVPRNTAASPVSIPRMTVLGIHSDSAGLPFIHVSFNDPTQKGGLKEVYLRNEGVSARPDDVQAALLLQLAAASSSPKQQEAFLTSGAKDYPGSIFLPQLQAALDALHSPPSQPTQSAQQTQQDQPAQPAQAAQPGQPAQPMQPAQPAATPALAPAQVPAPQGQAAGPAGASTAQ
ncbi:MAG: hypothetical protein ACLQCB_00080 [Spirochaetia bacterium]